MNKERIETLIAFIESEKHEWGIYDLSTCFLGQADIAFPDYDGTSLARHLDILSTSCGTCTNDNLVMPPNYDNEPEKYPRERAVRQLRHILKTGEVNWQATPYIVPKVDPGSGGYTLDMDPPFSGV